MNMNMNEFKTELNPSTVSFLICNLLRFVNQYDDDDDDDDDDVLKPDFRSATI